MYQVDETKLMYEWSPQKLLGRPKELGTSIFTAIDARVLLSASFIAIVALAAVKRWYVPGTVFVAIFFITMCTTSSRKSYFKRLMYPFTVALFIFIVQAYTYGSTVVQTLIWPIYAQGIASGWLICNRVLASVSILLLLMESKSQIELVDALAWFKIPIEIRDLMSLMFRYVSVISEEFTTMFNAQKSRLGYSTKLSFIKKLRNLAIIGGMLLVRSYDRSYRVVMSMMARGYTQNADIVHKFERFTGKDYLFAAFSLAVIAGIVLVGVV
ncbi:MAG: energy-coupling factor transporter transmembrane component T family protein [Halobacteriota archaeon]